MTAMTHTKTVVTAYREDEQFAYSGLTDMTSLVGQLNAFCENLEELHPGIDESEGASDGIQAGKKEPAAFLNRCEANTYTEGLNSPDTGQGFPKLHPAKRGAPHRKACPSRTTAKVPCCALILRACLAVTSLSCGQAI